MKKKITVLVIEDSALMRRELKSIIDSEPDLRVVGMAHDGIEGLQMSRKLEPDVVTIDVNLPGMDGLACLQHIMIETPRPCLMVSAYTGKNSAETFEALELGAVDFVEKPSGEISRDLNKKGSEIVSKIRIAHRTNLLSLVARRPTQEFKEKLLAPSKEKLVVPTRVVVIGVSTGGPRTLMDIIPALPESLNSPVLVIQHMPARFTASFADRLNKYSSLQVKEAQNGESLKNNMVYVAPGDYNLVLQRNNDAVSIVICKPSKEDVIVPCVDKALNSAIDVFGQQVVGVILTGMGDDGKLAMKRLHDLGGPTIAESRESAIIFGMPMEVINIGAARTVAHASKIAECIVNTLADIGYPKRSKVRN